MTSLEQAIVAAYQSQGKQADVVKVHALMLKTTFILPIDKNSPENNPQALFFQENSNHFVPVFETLEYFLNWAGDDSNDMRYLELPGYELVRGLSDHTYLCLNLGTPYYKEFAPDEIARLKSIVNKFSGA